MAAPYANYGQGGSDRPGEDHVAVENIKKIHFSEFSAPPSRAPRHFHGAGTNRPVFE
jgi:hypothetical protein